MWSHVYPAVSNTYRTHRLRLTCLAAVFLASAYGASVLAQTALRSEDLTGTWTGVLNVADLAALEIEIVQQPDGHYSAGVSSAVHTEDSIPIWMDGDRLRFQSSLFSVSFHVHLSADERQLDGFVHAGSHLSHITLMRKPGVAQPTWSGQFNSLGVTGNSYPLELYVEEDEGALAGYLFFRHQQLPSLWTYGLEVRGDSVSFREKNLSLVFSGPLEPTPESASSDDHPYVMRLDVSGLGGSVPITFRRSHEEILSHSERFVGDGDLVGQIVPRAPDRCNFEAASPPAFDDGWETSTPTSAGLDRSKLQEMITAICSQELTLTHSVLIARHGKLVVEEYFYGYSQDTPHDMRSASKTVTAALIGAAIDRGLIDSVQTCALDYFPPRRLQNWDPRKAQITLQHLLTMSSGLDADDTKWESMASENRYQSQAEQPDWIRLALDAPMIDDPGAQSLYGTANPMILGGVLQNVIDGPVETFAHRTFFEPLGITEYKLFLDPTGRIYMGGGLHLRPRDMAKFGQVHLDGGTWNGTRVLSEAWVSESMQKYGRLANARQNNEYGYLWWHQTYAIGDKQIESIEARGNGGQYIFVIPALDLVAVITGGNYRNGRYMQPEEVMERYILPAVL